MSTANQATLDVAWERVVSAQSALAWAYKEYVELVRTLGAASDRSARIAGFDADAAATATEPKAGK